MAKNLLKPSLDLIMLIVIAKNIAITFQGHNKYICRGLRPKEFERTLDIFLFEIQCFTNNNNKKTKQTHMKSIPVHFLRKTF